MDTHELSPQRLTIPEPPICALDFAFKPLQHPKVTNIILMLRPPSPVRLSRDHDQPLSGRIAKKTEKKKTENLCTFTRKEVNLCLRSNALFLKRAANNT